MDNLLLEATLTAPTGDELTGLEWDVTIIGGADRVLVHEGQEYILSRNGRLYSVVALRESVAAWDGVKVFDDHMTPQEWEDRMGMRSPKNEWLGTLVAPYWDESDKALKARLKLVERSLADKLLTAHQQGVLGSIGLSIDTFPVVAGEAVIDGRTMPIIGGFEEIVSVDLVGNPAAGGKFNRVLAADTSTHKESNDMDEETIKQMVDDAVAARLAQLEDESRQAEAEEADQDEESLQDDVTPELEAVRSQLMIERKLRQAALPSALEALVTSALDGRTVDEATIDKIIANAREAHKAADKSGKVQEAATPRISVGMNKEDKAQIDFMRLVWGHNATQRLGHQAAEHDYVAERMPRGYEAWIKDGRPNHGVYRVSQWLYEFAGGNPLTDARAMEAVGTGTLASVVKNAVNVMLASSYSQREEWWGPIVTTEEVDTIDQATLVRTYGVGSLDVVNEGAAYTELAMADEEETASFVKKGNYIGVTIEALMRDKVQELARIPQKLSNAWYNTLSDLVSGVFTVNSATGPVLSDTGALFNATAATSAGGHANLLTTALSYAAFDAAATAMAKQTDDVLGTGRRLGIQPRYLLVPVDLRSTAIQIRNSETFPLTTANTSAVNAYQGAFDVIQVPTFTDTNNWALVGDPQQFPAIFLIFPRGMRVPQLYAADSETSGSMFTNDELRYKVRLMTYRFSDTYDCAPVADFRPLHKSNVA